MQINVVCKVERIDIKVLIYSPIYATILLYLIEDLDVKIKCLEANKTQAQIGEEVGTTGQYVNHIIKKKDGIVNKTFVEMLEALGFDIELTYVPREK